MALWWKPPRLWIDCYFGRGVPDEVIAWFRDRYPSAAINGLGRPDTIYGDGCPTKPLFQWAIRRVGVAWRRPALRAIAWGGFDVALALLLLAVAFAAWRRSPWLEGTATATRPCSSWTPGSTCWAPPSTRTELIVAGLSAAFVELPLALLCLVLARDAERRLLAPALGLVQPEEAVARRRSAA